jgi:N-acetylmuramoyl-L-alanine amidase
LRLFLSCICGLFWLESWIPASAVAASGSDLKVTAIRTWEHPDYTRLVLELTSEVRPDIFLISNPYRIVLDLPQAEFLDPMEPRKGVGVIKNYRFGLFEPGVSRLVVDLTGPAIVKRNFVLPPTEQNLHRLVLDLRAATKKEFLAEAAGSQIKRSPIRESTDPINQENHSHNFTIVLDAGHGGVDPGAIGKNGLYEKTVALAAAQELQKTLQVLGPYRVLLTRNTDIYLPLRERVAVARRAKGDLFISIHADSIKNENILGSHVYTLSEKASDKEAAALAEKENQSDIIAGFDLEQHPTDVSSILVSLAQRETNNSSARAANSIVKEWRNRGLMLLRKPHRQAGFAVLKAPDVPSVLLELGFLSNATEAATLSKPASRKPLIDALAQSIHNYIQIVAQFDK